MKHALIKCSLCDEQLGTISKQEITEEDSALYAETASCHSGHLGSAILLVVDEAQLPQNSQSLWQRLISFFTGN